MVKKDCSDCYHRCAENMGEPEYSKCKKVIVENTILSKIIDPRKKQCVRHGVWKIVYRNKMATVYECSACEHLSFTSSKYCILCGARMDGGNV